jgi:allophanate hydrolase
MPLALTIAMVGRVTSLDITTLHRAYRERRLSPVDVVAAVYARIALAGDDRVWLVQVPRERAMARAAALDMDAIDRLPLFGLPFAIKDNIDAAGLPTTAGCPAFAYTPDSSAAAVKRLEAAGAVLIGKTNLDQFATGLVGVRSPYGVPRNPFDGDYIPGGSSSGSAVAVASGLVSFALGTDTAGSGRVPAAFNNIVGLKPSRGLISATGVVPACRSLDCVSVFSLTVPDAMAVLAAATGFDAADPYSRPPPAGWRSTVAAAPERFRFAVARPADRRFFGNDDAATLYDAAIGRLASLGGTAVPIDLGPWFETAELLYAGPWIAERAAALGDFLTTRSGSMLAVTRDIIAAGLQPNAVQAFQAQYRLGGLAHRCATVWREADCLLLPTAGTIFTLGEVAAEPVLRNSELGTYTNFVNLLDLAALAVPAGRLGTGLPFGVSLIGPAFHEPMLAALGQAFHRATGLALGATGTPQPELASAPAPAYPRLPLAVFGAHMDGLPLNHQLRALGARLGGPCRTAARYRMYRVPGPGPARPGLVKVATDGIAVEGEIWELPAAAVGAFLATIPAPLGLGTVELADGRAVKGFICEPAGLAEAEDISQHGGWRAYLAAE